MAAERAAPEGGAALGDQWQDAVVRPRGSAIAEQDWTDLSAPRLEADSGAGQVTLRWQPVEGAAGYLLYRAYDPNGPYELVDHGGGDLVKAVPGPAYADTTGARDIPAYYGIAAVAAADGPAGPTSEPVRGIPHSHRAQPVTIEVDPSARLGQLPRPWRMVGSEHLSQLFYPADARGIEIGAEFREALQLARQELGVQLVRAHSILHDELHVYREEAGRPVYDFEGIDRVYDLILQLGIRPVIEVSFMPHDLARDPSRTVFAYGAIISPPKDWNRWRDLVAALAQHLVDRYGLDEVSRWAFEIWNEANLEGFWSGSRDEYFRLYDEAAGAIRGVNPRLRVGGPGSAAAAWTGDMIRHAQRTGVALDFLSTHIYGMMPLNVGATASALGRPRLPIWWTEWGVNPRHFKAVNDAVFGAPFVLHGMNWALDHAEYLSYWVVSDHFEELGRPPRLFHGGFGLLTVGNLRKPRYWAIRMLQLLGSERLTVELAGDGAGSLVDALATRDEDGRISLLVWNGTLDQSKVAGDALLERKIQIQVRNVQLARYEMEHLRIDSSHSNVLATWEAIGSPDWPDPAGWQRLRSANRLETLEAPAIVNSDAGKLEISFALPMPAVSLIRLNPKR